MLLRALLGFAVRVRHLVAFEGLSHMTVACDLIVSPGIQTRSRKLVAPYSRLAPPGYSSGDVGCPMNHLLGGSY